MRYTIGARVVEEKNSDVVVIDKYVAIRASDNELILRSVNSIDCCLVPVFENPHIAEMYARILNKRWHKLGKAAGCFRYTPYVLKMDTCQIPFKLDSLCKTHSVKDKSGLVVEFKRVRLRNLK